MYCHLKSYSVLQNHETSWNHNILFSVSRSVSFCMFPCSKGHFIRAYLDTIHMALPLISDKKCLYFFDPTSFQRLGQRSKNNVIGFLVPMRTRKFAFEIIWPLAGETPSLSIIYISNDWHFRSVPPGFDSLFHNQIHSSLEKCSLSKMGEMSTRKSLWSVLFY